MRDEFDGRLWEANHEAFSAAIGGALAAAAARLRTVPHLAERVGGQLLLVVAASGIAATLSLGTAVA